MKFKLKSTTLCCPAQWEVLDENDNVCAYFRLRHGTFRVDVPDCGGETIYVSCPKGDGIFEEDEEEHYLKEAMNAVELYYKNESL